ncbi:methionine sulfoxide reductase B [Acaromyces ingoldii]|uniref:Peptide-methionine (R)-S-oxide reductase n=1 Tax=Acaromyces ingoldii TaxID=215250 RepID=A0A316YEK9_9BASI|nr:methionine sulfoxide reductase B [Acaromyces ingoldii]PWN87602.1 methionine sulfoxide reductase B [Acaromyces ingoldii]
MGSNASTASAPGNFPKAKSQEEWRTILSPAQFKVLRENGTEPGFSHEYEIKKEPGVYTCAACDTPLYKSDTKFKSGCGWPAFFDAIPGAVNRKSDWTFGMKRTEIRCAACDSHLGHVFEGEGFPTPTDERHCVNGICLRFNEEAESKTKANGGGNL